MNNILNCKELTLEIKNALKNEIENCTSAPRLAVIRIDTGEESNDFGNKRYFKNIEKSCNEVGIKFIPIELPFETTENEVLREISMLNKNKKINGIMVQYPVPEHINHKNINKEIKPIKDSDGLTDENLGRILSGDYGNIPCTPYGILTMLLHNEIKIKGSNIVVVGRSNIVGKPLTNLLINAGATVTCCNSNTKQLKLITKKADIVICSIGKAKFFTPKYFKNGQVIIDVGTNMDKYGKLCGDVDYDSVIKTLDNISITPVPGGIGAMTTTMLLSNVINSHKKMVNKNENTTERK